MTFELLEDLLYIGMFDQPNGRLYCDENLWTAKGISS